MCICTRVYLHALLCTHVPCTHSPAHEYSKICCHGFIRNFGASTSDALVNDVFEDWDWVNSGLFDSPARSCSLQSNVQRDFLWAASMDLYLLLNGPDAWVPALYVLYNGVMMRLVGFRIRGPHKGTLKSRIKPDGSCWLVIARNGIQVF